MEFLDLIQRNYFSILHSVDNLGLFNSIDFFITNSEAKFKIWNAETDISCRVVHDTLYSLETFVPTAENGPLFFAPLALSMACSLNCRRWPFLRFGRRTMRFGG